MLPFAHSWILLLVTFMFSDSYFFPFLQSFSVSVSLTCFSVIQSSPSGTHKCPCLVLSLAHTHAQYLTTQSHSHIMLHHVLSLCAVWHWVIGPCKAINGRLPVLSTNTFHTPSSNLFISVRRNVCICIHTQVKELLLHHFMLRRTDTDAHEPTH